MYNHVLLDVISHNFSPQENGTMAGKEQAVSILKAHAYQAAREASSGMIEVLMYNIYIPHDRNRNGEGLPVVKVNNTNMKDVTTEGTISDRAVLLVASIECKL